MAQQLHIRLLRHQKLQGFNLEGLRARYGITVEPDGTQTRALPVDQFAIPNPDPN